MASKAATRSKTAAAVTTITLPELAKGEHYTGIVLKDGAPSHHVILLPGELESGTWKEAIAWAKKQGGELPSRQEQALLFANAKEHFQPRWYWSGEQCAPGPSCAWYQHFTSGNQYYDRKGFSLRVRAVRRLAI